MQKNRELVSLFFFVKNYRDSDLIFILLGVYISCLFLFILSSMFKPLHSKKLPRTRSPQPKTIFIISAHDIARLFVVEQYDLHELSPLHTEATDYNYSDKE